MGLLYQPGTMFGLVNSFGILREYEDISNLSPVNTFVFLGIN